MYKLLASPSIDSNTDANVSPSRWQPTSQSPSTINKKIEIAHFIFFLLIFIFTFSSINSSENSAKLFGGQWLTLSFSEREIVRHMMWCWNQEQNFPQEFRLARLQTHKRVCEVYLISNHVISTNARHHVVTLTFSNICCMDVNLAAPWTKSHRINSSHLKSVQ
jgi:hypothetical protein